MKIIPNSFYILSLGCAKNTVDARSMSALLTQSGIREHQNSKRAEIIIVNTCGFIQPARFESIDTLNKLAGEKQANQILIAAGCLTEIEKEEILKTVPGLDAAFGTRRWMDIVRVVRQVKQNRGKPQLHFPMTERIGSDPAGIMRTAIQGGSAYIKIADGCDRSCAFCAIPGIKGRMVSRPLDAILQDVKRLADLGTQELILIAQDSTSWGRDLGMTDGLPILLEEIVKLQPEIPWIRILYAFPGEISPALIRLFKTQPRILPYIDIPLQHAHPSVLRAMRRPSDINATKKLLISLKKEIPQIAIRTTFIVGFPGEGEAEFNELVGFIRTMRFDRVGIFPYYHEKGTISYNLRDEISQEEKERRLSILALTQESISEELNRSFIGKEMDVLIEGNNGGLSIGRSYRDAPEIDGLVFIKSHVEIGKIVKTRIIDAWVHDLQAEII